MMAFQVKTTSAEVNGRPSLQRVPLRSLKVQVFWSGATNQDSARPGFGSWVVMSMLIRAPLIRRTMASDEPSNANMELKVLGPVAVASTKVLFSLPQPAARRQSARSQI